MTAVKAAMTWDEAAFGREYDLVGRALGQHHWWIPSVVEYPSTTLCSQPVEAVTGLNRLELSVPYYYDRLPLGDCSLIAPRQPSTAWYLPSTGADPAAPCTHANMQVSMCCQQ